MLAEVFPSPSTELHSHSERFVRTISEESLDRMILFGEAHLRRVERSHQGIGNELIDRRAATGVWPIECTERLGGLLKFYHRAA